MSGSDSGGASGSPGKRDSYDRLTVICTSVAAAAAAFSCGSCPDARRSFAGMGKKISGMLKVNPA